MAKSLKETYQFSQDQPDYLLSLLARVLAQSQKPKASSALDFRARL
jgi:hypothetical protein